MDNTTKRTKVTNAQIASKLDILIELMIAQQQNIPVQPEPKKAEPTPKEEAQKTAKNPWSDKYAAVQSKAMAQYAATKNVRYYMFTAVNKAGQVKLRFYSQDNVVKFGTPVSTAVAYCDPGKKTVWL